MPTRRATRRRPRVCVCVRPKAPSGITPFFVILGVSRCRCRNPWAACMYVCMRSSPQSHISRTCTISSCGGISAARCSSCCGSRDHGSQSDHRWMDAQGLMPLSSCALHKTYYTQCNNVSGVELAVTVPPDASAVLLCSFPIFRQAGLQLWPLACCWVNHRDSGTIDY